MTVLFTRFPKVIADQFLKTIGYTSSCETRKPRVKFQFLRMSSDSKSTVDALQVDIHGDLSKEWWDPNGLMKGLHAMNAIRVPFIKNGLVYSDPATATKTEECLKDLKILDVGCAGGFLTEPLSLMGAAVTGIEPSSELIQVAKTHAALNPVTKNIRYIVCTAEDHIKDHAQFYDAVIASEVIEHVTNPEVLIKSCITALKPGGSIFITTPNKTFMSWLCGIYIAENILKIIVKGTHSYDRFIPPHQLQQILEKNHCRTVKMYYSVYNILTNKWSLSAYKGLQYGLHAVKLSVASQAKV